ncbi:hypothetical protein HWI79_1227 [Cryptosporidium felis]|nr:hypothetical protein HWI79_1227 [Cryptosporidium felis]
MECLICFSDLNEANSVEYKTGPSSEWYRSNFCLECIESLKKSQFHRYCDSITNTKCLKEQKALLLKGPPINVWDKHGFPECGENEVFQLCRSNDKTIISPKLDGSLVGDERLNYWNYLKQFISSEMLKSEKNDQE